MWPNEWRQ